MHLARWNKLGKRKKRMAKSKNNVAGLLASLAQGSKTSGLGNNSQNAGSSKVLTAGSPGGTKATSISGASLSAGISFGRPASTKTPSATSGTDWGELLEQAASGGLASALAGGFGLGSITGLGSIVSSIASLFSSEKKGPAALQEFKLPATQNLTISVGTNGASGATATSQSLQDQSTQIAQAVKTALLHSSSLNDVIAEI
jgi:hypothetical protein